jgi:amino acid adenylation domain-containing protein
MKHCEDVSVRGQDPSVHNHIGEGPPPEHRPSVIDEIYDLMAQTPHAVAVTDRDLEWTYDALRRRSDLVAKSLASHGVTRGSVVGMHLPRCADAIAVMLGIMASGCVYLPLDPSYPAARLRSMIDRAGAVAVISRDSDPDLYGSQRIWLPSSSQVAAEPQEPVSEQSACSAEREPLKPEDYAYIIFTSGSTGVPKGVLVSHGNITLLAEWSSKTLGLTPFDASATSSSLSFDPSFLETLLPLSVGGTVHVIPHALELGQLTRPVSYVATTPTVANELLRAGQLPHLKVLVVGGEALAPDVAARLLSSGRVERLLNLYGPTECTVAVTVAEIAEPVPELISIGRQAPGTEILMLDGNGQRLSDGEVGEICIFGGQVADGYVNDPAGAAERFATGPGPASDPQRYYRTGDLGYRADDGMIYFTGRADRQVKINGHRIELGEIDAVLRSHPQVSEATTLVQDGARTVAYVVPAQADSDVDIQDLKRHCSGSLPRYMVPAGIMILPELPVTVTGKLDASGLPKWSPGRSEGQVPGTDQLDQVTASVIQIVSDVTGFVGQIHPSDDFINDLGGTSLDLVQVLVEFEGRSGRRMRISDALADTTVAGLACLLQEQKVTSAADFAFNTDGDAQPLILIHAYLGGMLMLRRVAERLPSNQPIYGFQIYGADGPPDEITISSLAEEALSRIREVQAKGQIVLIGHSAGGLIAYEAACRMADAGEQEPRVLLMDIPRLQGAISYYWCDLLMSDTSVPMRIVRAIATRLLRIAKLLKSRPRVAPQADDLIMATEEHLNAVEKACRRYKTSVYNGNLTVMSTRQGRRVAFGRRSLGWDSVATGTIETMNVPGTHLTLLDAPHIDFVTEQLSNWLTAKSHSFTRQSRR